MTIVATRDEEITVQEFDRRTKMVTLMDTLQLAEENAESLQKAVSADSDVDTAITEKKRMLGGPRYVFQDVEYETEAAAREKQQAALAEFAGRQREYDEAVAAMSALKNELASLGETTFLEQK